MKITKPANGTVGVPEVLAILDQVLAEIGPDTIDRNRATHGACYYWRPDDMSQPSCIVGQVLARLGFTESDVEAQACAVFNVTSTEHGWHGQGWNRQPFTSDALEILALVQWLQDRGCAWGHCVAEARRRAEGY